MTIMKKIYPIYSKKQFANFSTETVVVGTKEIILHYLHNILNFSHLYKSKKNYNTIPFNIVKKQLQNTSNQEIKIVPLGHATILISYKKKNILIDPIFQTSSFFFKRFSENIYVNQLPHIDYIIYSHNHPDHYNSNDLKKLLLRFPQIKIFAPLEWESFLEKEIGSPITVFSLNWWETEKIDNDISITALPAIHWSQSNIHNRNKTLWASWMISIKEENIYFAGDTAYSNHFSMIKEEFKKITIAILPIAPYEPVEIQIDSHINIAESYQAFLDLGEPIFIPMHWGVFAYGEEPLKEPIEKIIILMKQQKNLEKLQSTTVNKIFSFNIE